MSRAEQARAREKARAREASRHEVMGTCPRCDREITTDQRTAWRYIEGAPARVHQTCT